MPDDEFRSKSPAPDDPSSEDEDAESASEPMDQEAFNRLVERLYAKLKPLARKVRASPRNPTLSPTVLLHDAYIKLSRGKQLADTSDKKVLEIFAHVMKEIVIDGARRKLAQKHGGGAIDPLDGEGTGNKLGGKNSGLPYEEMLTVTSAIEELRQVHPRQADIVDKRYLLGLTVEEVAQVLGLSKATVERDYKDALISLRSKLR